MNYTKSNLFEEYRPVAVFLLAAAIYFAMSYPLSLLVRAMENRLRATP